MRRQTIQYTLWQPAKRPREAFKRQELWISRIPSFPMLTARSGGYDFAKHQPNKTICEIAITSVKSANQPVLQTAHGHGHPEPSALSQSQSAPVCQMPFPPPPPPPLAPPSLPPPGQAKSPRYRGPDAQGGRRAPQRARSRAACPSFSGSPASILVLDRPLVLCGLSDSCRSPPLPVTGRAASLPSERLCWSGSVNSVRRPSDADALIKPSAQNTSLPRRFAFWTAPRDSPERVEYSRSLMPFRVAPIPNQSNDIACYFVD